MAENPLPTLQSFAEEWLREGREAFLRAHPDPVLLVQLGQAPLDDGELRTTAMAHGQPSRGPGWEMVVAEIRKRTADPFKAFIWVGRDAGCDVILPFDSISKLQAQFQKREGGYLLLDVGSKNGTAVGGEALQRDRPHPVPDGAELHFGQVRARFCMPARFASEVEFVANLKR